MLRLLALTFRNAVIGQSVEFQAGQFCQRDGLSYLGTQAFGDRRRRFRRRKPALLGQPSTMSLGHRSCHLSQMPLNPTQAPSLSRRPIAEGLDAAAEAHATPVRLRSRLSRSKQASLKAVLTRSGCASPKCSRFKGAAALTPSMNSRRRPKIAFPTCSIIKLNSHAIGRIHRSFTPILKPNVTGIIDPGARCDAHLIDNVQAPAILGHKGGNGRRTTHAILHAAICAGQIHQRLRRRTGHAKHRRQSRYRYQFRFHRDHTFLQSYI